MYRLISINIDGHIFFLTQLTGKRAAKKKRLVSGALIGLSALVAYQADGRLKQCMMAAV